MNSGLYVYGIVDGGALDGAPDVTGVDPSHAPALFDGGGLTAIVSEVDVSEFEGEALERNAAQADWLETKVRSHESVLDQIVGATTVVPMRFGAIFSTSDGLRAMLEDHGAALKESLERVRGRSEWGVKVHVEARHLVEQMARTESPSDEPSGRNYLLQKKAQRDAQANAANQAAEVSARVHDSLSSLADGATTMSLRSRGEGSTIVLNGAYLVPDGDRETFMRRVEELQKEHSEAYLFEVTGPWPPYNFTSADVAGPRG